MQQEGCNIWKNDSQVFKGLSENGKKSQVQDGNYFVAPTNRDPWGIACMKDDKCRRHFHVRSTQK